MIRPARLREARRVVQHQQVGQPESQAVDQQAALRGSLLAQYPCELQGFFDQCPMRRAPLTVMGDTLGHLPIQRLAGGDIGDRQAAFGS